MLELALASLSIYMMVGAGRPAIHIWFRTLRIMSAVGSLSRVLAYAAATNLLEPQMACKTLVMPPSAGVL